MMEELLIELKNKCYNLFPIEIRSLYLIGSSKFKQLNNNEIDIAAIIENHVSKFSFVCSIIPEINKLIVTNNLLISIFPIYIEEYEKGESQFIKNIKRNGVKL